MAPNLQSDILQRHDVLRDVVQAYPGILSAAEPLFQELSSEHPDWSNVIKELRSHALKNFSLHEYHEKGLDAVSYIVDVFLGAIEHPDPVVSEAACQSLVLYLEKILIDSRDLSRYSPILDRCWAHLRELDEEHFSRFVTSAHPIKKLGHILLGKRPEGIDVGLFNTVLTRYFAATFSFWLREKDPIEWLQEVIGVHDLKKEQLARIEELFAPVSHEHFRDLLVDLETSGGVADHYLRLQRLLALPGFVQVVNYYEDAADRLGVTGVPTVDLALKIKYLVGLTDIRGLASIHENAIREMNRTASELVRVGTPDDARSALVDVFTVLKRFFRVFPDSVLQCTQNIGIELYRKDSSTLVEWYLQRIIGLGFHRPDITGVTDEWQVKANRAHLQNIRVWLELIKQNPKWSKSLISALIINLRLGGVHISDTDVFQKDVTHLLNSDIQPVYHLLKLLAKVFPVYFSEIGAEGPLRDVSTEIDELTHRRDALVHFLRKQSHVESSARVVEFIEAVISYWLTRDRTSVRGFVPEDVFEKVGDTGPYVDEMHVIFTELFRRKGFSQVSDLLKLSEGEMLDVTRSIESVTDREKKRACLAVTYYQLLNRKYRLDPQGIADHLAYAPSLGLPSAEPVLEALRSADISARIRAILDYLHLLKEIVVSPDRNEPVENIFRKRHIAAGIPSLYGKYHERKFDALALSFRLEILVNTLFEELVQSINLTFITRATLFQIEKYVTLFSRALRLDGISSIKLENAHELLSVALEVRRFSFSQYIDIFRGFSEAVQDIVNTYYSDIFKHTLKLIIPQIGTESIQPRYRQAAEWQTESEFVNQVSEHFLREIVAGSFGLQQLDTFISRVLKTLFEQAEGLDVQNLDLLMSYDPKKALSAIHAPNPATQDRIHLGNKGHNLIRLAALGIPVPPGFIITTEVFRCKRAIYSFHRAREHLTGCIRHHLSLLEEQTGKVFGDVTNPLLVSVRSGGAISMPGMMISFLNVGMNEQICEGLIRQTGKPWFVWDCYHRFLQCWGMSYGMERDRFDAIMNSFKERFRVPRKIQFTPDQMREVALSYRAAVTAHGITVIDEPRDQLETAIDQVFQSWYSAKAQTYREIMGISEHWGTAVIVQAMVYGNLDVNSGTGVLFTKNPQEAGDRVMLWGDFAVGAQGEDIVSGLVRALAISNEQKPLEDRDTDITFEDSFPELYANLLQISKKLIYHERWGAQEIEFTFEGRKPEHLFILQTRDMAIKREDNFLAFVPTKKLSSSYLSRGIGVGGGALSGRAVFDLTEIMELRRKDPHTPLILIRADTVPDDIRHISAADGLLTARGGSTSHASIIANRLGKTCVVGCNNLTVWEQEKKCKINKKIIKTGDFLSIDGRSGSVFAGRHQTQAMRTGASVKA